MKHCSVSLLLCVYLFFNTFSSLAQNLQNMSEDDVKIAMLKPTIEARANWPDVKDKFLSGLPPTQTLMVTCFITTSNNKRVQTFLKVNKLKNDSIYGEINIVETSVTLGDHKVVAERDILDWSLYEGDKLIKGDFDSGFLSELNTPEANDAYIKQCWIKAKQPFLKGLKKNEKLEVTAKIAGRDSVFYIAIHVNKMIDDRIIGITSEKMDTYTLHDPIEVKDDEIIDWNYSPSDPRPQKE